MEQIQIIILPNGEIKAETKGVKGKKCLKYISEIERLTDAIVIDSDFTHEYLGTDNLLDLDNEQEVKA